MRAGLFRIVGTIAAVLAAYFFVLLRIPQPFFSFSVQSHHLGLYSDRPLGRAAAEHVLALAQAKLTTSPFYSNRQEYNVFICNARWRQILFFNKDYGAGGVAPYTTSNVFLRDALVESNQLVSPAGTPILGDRTLDYFIAHEVTHQMVFHSIGPLAFYNLPQWVREGYADYVGKGNTFNYSAARRAFLADVPEMDWTKSGLYWRFHLLVAYLLDHRHWSAARLLHDPPSLKTVESEVREEKP